VADLTGFGHIVALQLGGAVAKRRGAEELEQRLRPRQEIVALAERQVEARAMLEGKALQLMGGATSAVPPASRLVYAWHITEGRADIFLAYCTATRESQKQSPNLQIVELPDNLSVAADYGLTVITGAFSAAERFAQFIMSPTGQKVLTSHGFASGQIER
jgi:molybdate transport system substrate-binding protein